MGLLNKPQEYYFNNKKGCVITVILFAAGLVLILVGGPALSRWADRSYRNDINKNGLVIDAVVFRKSSHKGRHVYFSYQFKGRKYSNSESGSEYYENLVVGEPISIMIDTTDPGDSYIFSTGVNR